MLISNEANIEAVNRVLGAIGDSPVDTIENPTNVNVINAIRELEVASRQEQARSWNFNTLDNYVLNADVNTRRIGWSKNFLHLEATDDRMLVHRGDYLYDLTNKTYEFSSDVTVKLVLQLELEELPEPMVSWIIAVASERFQRKYLNDNTLAEELAQEKAEAWARVNEYEISINSYNIFNNEDISKIARA